MENCILCDREFGQTKIREYKNWMTKINFKQPTLGSALIVPYKHITRLEELSKEEKEEYWEVIIDLEKSIRRAFNPDQINYQMLSNLEPHIHYHVIPRYRSIRNFSGMEWFDLNFPKNPDTNIKARDKSLLDNIILELNKPL